LSVSLRFYMLNVQNYLVNPFFGPNLKNTWEKMAAFNGNILKANNKYYLFYRALSDLTVINGKKLHFSTIGIAEGKNKYNFLNRRQLIIPEQPWEKFGCEDPRVTKIDDKFLIFYTAIGGYPPSADNIKIALAITDNVEHIHERHLVTPFNAKAMALFPKKINNKYTAVLSVNTDSPPAKICLATFDSIEEIWSEQYWKKWYSEIDKHELPFARLTSDQVEVGAVPLETKEGWLIIYSHIQNYYNRGNRIFGIEAALLDKENPLKIISQTKKPLIAPQELYELQGMIPGVIFPSGAIIEDDQLYIYYGVADTSCALSSCSLSELLKMLLQINFGLSPRLSRFKKNPVITPIDGHPWEAKATFNPGAILIENNIYIVYRAMSFDNTSVFGLAVSDDGFNIKERLSEPIYSPRFPFEGKTKPGGNSGCEDARLTRIGNEIYMCYTAYNGSEKPKIAMSSIMISDFINYRWNWSSPIIISNPNIDDKDGVLLPEKVNGKFVFFHRSGGRGIIIDYVDDLEFGAGRTLEGEICINVRENSWDSAKIGISNVPLKTEKGWLVLYHGVSKYDNHYRVGAMLFELKQPTHLIGRSLFPLLEPEMVYEKIGQVHNVVFPCGAVVKDNLLFVYYGGADDVVGIATGNIKDIIDSLLVKIE